MSDLTSDLPDIAHIIDPEDDPGWKYAFSASGDVLFCAPYEFNDEQIKFMWGLCKQFYQTGIQAGKVMARNAIRVD